MKIKTFWKLKSATKDMLGLGIKMRDKFLWISFMCKNTHEWDPTNELNLVSATTTACLNPF